MPTVAAGPERPPSPARTPATPAQRLEPRVRGRFSGPPWRRVLSAVAVVALLVCGAFGFVVAYAAFTLPSIDNLGAATGSLRILDRHGALIADVGFGATPHDTVTLDQVSPAMRVAILAAEDRQFYTEGAINPGRILKALVVDVILRRPAQGASTITEQLARNVFLPQDKSVMRKLREALLADQIDQRYPKPQILEMYLNAIYFGHGAYGVEDAAETYFGVHANALTLPQAALIAGLPQAPSASDPYVNPQGAFARMHYVLDGMVTMGAITPATAAAIDPLICGDMCARFGPAASAVQVRHQQTLLRSLHDSRSAQAGVQAPHFVAYVRNQLADLFKDDPQALSGTLTVRTTLDLGIQRQAQNAVARGVATIGRNANNGALLMLDTHTGGILAMVGSADYNNASIAGEFNVATALRRPGSSFKPYVYEQALREGAITMSSIVDDTPRESRSLNGVQDWDGNFMGQMPAWQALLLSRNVPTEQVMEKAGPENVIRFAHSLGIASTLADNASTAIGSSAVRMLDHAAAYAAFADGGSAVQPSSITRVANPAGAVLYNASPPMGSTVMTPQQAYGVTGVLRQYNRQWHDGITRDVGSKSGTTDNFTDAWFMAYTPDWVVATWAGHTSGSDPAEVGMNAVYGNDVGMDIAAPFINGLSASAGFTVPPGSPSYSTSTSGGAPPSEHGKGHKHGGG